MQNSRDRQQRLIENLDLQHLNLEAGWFSLASVSPLSVSSDGETLRASNMIYLMLNEQEPINYVQWLASDDYQVLIEGGPADYYLFYPDGTAEKKTMGSNVDGGEVFAVHAPAGTAKAIVLSDQADYLLAASIVTPAWTPTRVRIGGDEDFIARYIDSAEWATMEKLLQLLGPNYGQVVGGDPNHFQLHIDTAGQILFLGMQLSLQQALDELGRMQERASGTEVVITCQMTDQSIATQLADTAKRLGLQPVRAAYPLV